ncbi:MAG TPA: beta-eliminating lyase-related protein [Myxococcales bacterium]|jgi:threonine aldolase
MPTFRSDNNAGLLPEALEAFTRAARADHASAYGDDPDTAGAVEALRSLFGPRTEAFFVATGTAANTLAVASLTRPWQRVLCHDHAHWVRDESTAPERITGCRAQAIPCRGPKVTLEEFLRCAKTERGDVHEPQPGVLTLSNPTEFGVAYPAAELSALCAAAHEHGFRVHVDGARFANAVAFLGCEPRALAGDAGVDALSFGGTKNGLAYGEAVLFFPQGDGAAFREAVRDFPFHRKASGHLLSKHRFVSAPFAAALSGGAWLRHAAHANAMAQRLGAGLSALGYPPRFAVESNGVFVSLPDEVVSRLKARGHDFYGFGDPEWKLVRLMASFDTRPEDVDALLADVRG